MRYEVQLKVGGYERQRHYSDYDEAFWWFGKTCCVLPEAEVILVDREQGELMQIHTPAVGEG